MTTSLLLAADQGATSADWLEAWAAVLAAVGTIGAFVWQGIALRRERTTRRSEITRLESQQARTVVPHSLELMPGDLYMKGLKGAVTKAKVGNYGDQPITKVLAHLRWTDSAGDVHEANNASVYSVLAGGEVVEPVWIMSESFDVVMPPAGSYEERQAELSLYVKFRDVHGVSWGVRVGHEPERLPYLA